MTNDCAWLPLVQLNLQRPFRRVLLPVERARGELREARKQIEATLSIVDSLRTEIGDPRLRSSYFASTQKYYEFYIDLLMQLHKQRPSEGFDALALEASERARARGFLELLTEANRDIHQGIAPELIERERSLRRLISVKFEQQNQLLRKEHTEEQAATVAKEIYNLTIEHQELLTQIKKQSPQYSALI